MTLIHVGIGLLVLALFAAVCTVCTIILKSKASLKIANAPIEPLKDIPDFLKRGGPFGGLQNFHQISKQVENRRKAHESMAGTILTGNLVMVLAGVLALVGVIILLCGIIEKFQPTWVFWT